MTRYRVNRERQREGGGGEVNNQGSLLILHTEGISEHIMLLDESADFEMDETKFRPISVPIPYGSVEGNVVNISSRTIIEVKQHAARRILGWESLV